MESLISRARSLLKWSERYTRTDMVYLAASGFWGNLGTLSVTVFSLALYLVFANVLPKTAFGTYQYLLSLGALIGALTFTGMNAAVSRSVARGHQGSLRQAVRFQLAWSWLPIAAGLMGAGYYAYQGNLALALGLLFVGVGTPLVNVFNTYSAHFVGTQDFRRVFLYNFAINVPFYAILITAAFLTVNPILLIGINMLIQVAGYLAAYLHARKQVSNDSVEPGMLTYGTHLSAMGLPGTIAQHIDTVLAFQFLGPVGVAIYAFSTAIPERISGLFKFLPSAALPRFSNRPLKEVQSGILPRVLMLLPILLGTALLYAAVAPYIFLLLFPEYVEAVPYSAWYGLVLISVITQVVLAALSAHKQVRRLYAFNIMSPVMQVSLQLAGVILFGLWGLIAGRLTGTLLSALLALLLLMTARPTDGGR